MIVIIKNAAKEAIKQWQLFLFTIITSVVFQMDYGIGDENFGLVMLIGIPYFFYIIFTFYLTKLIYKKREHPQTTLLDLLKDFFVNAHKLFIPMVGLMIGLLVGMMIIITMVYGVFNILGIENSASIFESGVTDLNFLLFYLGFSIASAFLSFHGVLYFIKDQPFFIALKNSIPLAKKHLQFTLLVGIFYFVTTCLTNLVGSDQWYKNIINGVLYGVEYYFIATVIIIYYLKHVKD